MESFARMIVASFELVEAEGRVLKQQLLRMAIAIALGIIVTILTITGLAFLIWGLFEMLAIKTNTATAAVIFGLITLVTALVGGYIVRRLLLPPKPTSGQTTADGEKAAENLKEATERAEAHADRVPDDRYAPIR